MIQVVDRTFDILEMLAESPVALSNTEIAEKMHIKLQTANNLLRTLYRRGYVAQDESRNYLPGAQCFFLGNSADRWALLRKRIAEPLQKLSDRIGLTGFAGVVENDQLLGIAMTRPGISMPSIPRQSWWDELHSTACGRVLLAAYTPAVRAKLFARMACGKMTDQTVIEPVKLEKICRKIAVDGFGEVRDESRPGVSSLAVPLRDLSGRIFAAIAISGIDAKWDMTSLEHKLQLLRDTADQIEFA